MYLKKQLSEQMQLALQQVDSQNEELKKVINTQNGRHSEDKRTIDDMYPNLSILRLLGRGSFGSVHECYDKDSKQSKALKIQIHEKEELLHNLKEIAIISKINEHFANLMPQINAYDTYHDRGSGFHKTKILMDITYCTFTTLAKAKNIADTQFTETELFIILLKLSDAFRKLQNIGIAHRDIKPDNVMIDEDLNQIKIIDIGEADYTSLDTNHEIQAFGTPMYAAPEIKYLMDNDGEENIEKQYGNYIKSDVYSLALTIIFMNYPKSNRQFLIKKLDKELTNDFPNMADILKNMTHSSQQSRPDFQEIYLQCNKYLESIQDPNRTIFLNEKVKQTINELNIVGLDKNSFEENLEIIEAYLQLQKIKEATNIINNMQNHELDYYQKITLICLQIIIILQSVYQSHEIDKAYQLLSQIENLINQANLSRFDEHIKIRSYLNKTAQLIYNDYPQFQDIGFLLHTLTFITKGKNIIVKKKWFEDKISTLKVNQIKTENQQTINLITAHLSKSQQLAKLPNLFYNLTQKYKKETNNQTTQQKLTLHIKNINKSKVISNGHSSKVNQVILISQNLFATCSNDKTIKIWNSTTAECINTLTGHEYNILSIGSIHNTSLIFAGDSDSQVILWNYLTGECTKFRGHGQPVNSVGYIPNSQLILTSSFDDVINVWNYLTGDQIITIDTAFDSVNQIIVTKNQQLFICACADSNLRIWNYQTYKCIKVLEGHSNSVLTLVQINDTELIASGSQDQTVKIWNYLSQELIQTLQGHNDIVSSITFIQNTQLIASSSNDKTIKLWNYQTGQCIRTLDGYENYINCIIGSPDTKSIIFCIQEKLFIQNYETQQYSPNICQYAANVKSIANIHDTKFIACGLSDNSIQIWNYENLCCISMLLGHFGQVNQLIQILNTKILISASKDKTLKIWNYQTNDCMNTLQGHQDSVNVVIIIDNQNLIGSGSSDKTIKIWNYQNGECILTMQDLHTNSVITMSQISNTKLIVSGSLDGRLKIWNYEIKECVNTLEIQDLIPVNLLQIQNTKLVACGYSDSIIRIWDIDQQQVIYKLEGHKQQVNILTQVYNTNLIISGSEDKTLKIWNYETQQLVKSIEGHISSVNSVISIPNTNFILSSSQDNSVKLWNYEKTECIQTLKGHVYEVLSLTQISDTNLIASVGQDEQIKIWDYQDGKCINTIQAHYFQINAIIQIYNTGLLATCSSDKSIKIWKYEDSKCIGTLTGHYDEVSCIASIPQTKFIVSGSHDKTVKIWNYLTNECINTMKGHRVLVKCVTAIPNTKLVASGSADEEIIVWNYESGEKIRSLHDYTDQILSVTSILNTKLLASGNADTTIKIWNYENGKAINTLRGHSNWVNTVKQIEKTKLILSGSHDKTLKIWNYESGECIHTFLGHNSSINQVLQIQNSQLICTCSSDETLKIWDYSGIFTKTLAHSPFRPLQFLYNEKNTPLIWLQNSLRFHQIQNSNSFTDFSISQQCLCITQNGIFVGLGVPPYLIYYQTLSNVANNTSNILQLAGHQDNVNQLWHCKSFNRIYSSSLDSTIRQWNLSTKQCLLTIKMQKQVLNLCTIKEGGLLVYSFVDESVIRLKQIQTNNIDSEQLLDFHESQVTTLLPVQFNKDYLLSGSDDFLVILWDIQQLQKLAIFNQVKSPITIIITSDDGYTAIIGYKKGFVAIWDLKNYFNYEISRVLLGNNSQNCLVGALALVNDSKTLLVACYNTNTCITYQFKLAQIKSFIQTF